MRNAMGGLLIVLGLPVGILVVSTLISILLVSWG